MPVTGIDIYQSNYVGESDLMSVHNPLIFIVNANYTGAAPTVLYCDIYDSTPTLLGRYSCIPYLDISASQRQFIFIADGILRGFMEEFDDFVQSSESIDYCEGFTKDFTLTFIDELEAEEVELDIVAIHTSRQFGNNPNPEDIYNNESKTYVGIEGLCVYTYIYNNSVANFVSNVEGGSDDLVLLDYDDEEFSDFDDELLTALTV